MQENMQCGGFVCLASCLLTAQLGPVPRGLSLAGAWQEGATLTRKHSVRQ